MNGDFAAALRVLPDYLGHHVRLSAAALALGLIISLPLAVAASRSARLRWPLLTAASIIQTIPSLALLALFYPLLLVLSSASQALSGHGFSALGFLPALAALTLYSILPILIGDGIPFFEKLDRDIALHLAGVKAYKSGMVELRYEVRQQNGRP